MVKDIVNGTRDADSIKWEALHRKLLVIEPLEYQQGIKTKFTKPGEAGKDAVRANIWVLTGPDTHDEYLDTLVFPGYLVGGLRREIGNLVVGRLTQGADDSKGNPPWLLAEASESDMEKARRFLAAQQTVSASSSKREPEADNDGFDAEDDEPAY